MQPYEIWNQCKDTERLIAIRSHFQLYFEGVKDVSKLSSFICVMKSLLLLCIYQFHILQQPRCGSVLVFDNRLCESRWYLTVSLWCQIVSSLSTAISQWHSSLCYTNDKAQHFCGILNILSSSYGNAGRFICPAHTAWMLVTVKVNDVSLKK